MIPYGSKSTIVFGRCIAFRENEKSFGATRCELRLVVSLHGATKREAAKRGFYMTTYRLLRVI